MLEFGSQSSHPSEVLKKTAASTRRTGRAAARTAAAGADGGGADGGGGRGRGDGGSGDGATPMTR